MNIINNIDLLHIIIKININNNIDLYIIILKNEWIIIILTYLI